MDDDPPPSPKQLEALIPAAKRATIPVLYATEEQADPIVHVKLFAPWANWTWYVTEFDGERLCFGLVDGHEAELGYFDLHEIARIEGPAELMVERDIHFKPQPLSRVRAELAPPEPPSP